MNFFRIDTSDQEKLINMPESGMGYQVIVAGGTHFLLFNAIVAIELAEYRESRFTENDHQVLSGDIEGQAIRRLKSRDFRGEFLVAYSDFDSEQRRGQLPFAHNPNAIPPISVYWPSSKAFSYYRFSAYFRDKRVDVGGFKPGTYATTYNDLHFVPSGFAAVGRYALPNPASAICVYQIVTFDKPDLMGTATPNNGQAGGGVEVYFRNGALNVPGAFFSIDAG